MFADVVEHLKSFPDLDKMLCGLTTVPKSVTPKTAKVGIDTLIFLKQTLKIAPMLANTLEAMRPRQGGQSRTSQYGETLFSTSAQQLPAQSSNAGGSDSADYALLDAIIANLREPQLQLLLDDILDTITESTEYSRSAHEMRHQECFALKNGIHGLLDVARKTFLQTVEDIYRVRWIG